MYNKISLNRWMKRELTVNTNDYVDSCGEVNATLLAERCAEQFNLYEDEIDYNIPELIFDIAAETSIAYERSSLCGTA